LTEAAITFCVEDGVDMTVLYYNFFIDSIKFLHEPLFCRKGPVVVKKCLFKNL
jgi:hypothetical protein